MATLTPEQEREGLRLFFDLLEKETQMMGDEQDDASNEVDSSTTESSDTEDASDEESEEATETSDSSDTEEEPKKKAKSKKSNPAKKAKHVKKDKKEKKHKKDKKEKKEKKHKKEKKEKKHKKDKKEKKSNGKRGPKGAQWLNWKGNPYQPDSILHNAFKEASGKGGIDIKKLAHKIKKWDGTPEVLIRKLRTGHSKGFTWEVDDAHGRLRLTNLKLSDKRWKRA